VGRIDLLEAAAEAGQGPRVVLERGPAEVLQQVVVLMNAVEGGLARQSLVEVPEVVVDKMGKWLRLVHA
jgi:hypothetical protein